MSKEIHWCLSTTSKNVSYFLNFPPNFYNKPTVTVGSTYLKLQPIKGKDDIKFRSKNHRCHLHFHFLIPK